MQGLWKTLIVLVAALGCGTEPIPIEPLPSEDATRASSLKDGAERDERRGTRKKDEASEEEEEEEEELGRSDGRKSSDATPTVAERAAKSACRFFTSTTPLNFSEKPAGFNNSQTNIDHFPPAQYPMPAHQTFEDGEFEGTSFKLVAMVDIKIGYRAADPYESKWKVALPDQPEDPSYERRYFEVTIADADQASCTVSHQERK